MRRSRTSGESCDSNRSWLKGLGVPLEVMEGVLGREDMRPALKLGRSRWKLGVEEARGGGAEELGFFTLGTGPAEGEDVAADDESSRGSFLMVFLVPLGGMVIRSRSKIQGQQKVKRMALK